MSGPDIAARRVPPRLWREKPARGDAVAKSWSDRRAKKPGRTTNPFWDGSGSPIGRCVETLLRKAAADSAPPALPAAARVARLTTWTMRSLSAAAAVLLIAAAGWLVFGRARGGWSVQTLAGTPIVDGLHAGDARSASRLGIGEWLVTDGISRARIAVGEIGRVDVEPNTRLQLMEARGREHRMALARGTIHARIWAPPKFFYVNTPSARDRSRVRVP